ncbi:MAG: hypothetical protein NT039_01805 [Candidatus Berkelbacteria bacterium]|nr:hypothetical protein [Candidatus Berkelbacteria bacterium]
MKILIFTEGTIIMHKNAKGHSREEIVKQSEGNEESLDDFASYIPIGNAPKKIKLWQEQGAEICYLTSRREPKEIKDIKNVLKKYHFPEGKLYFRKDNEEYKDVAERVIPDILIEDDCESIGGEEEMTYPHINDKIKKRIKLISVKEFGGIDHLLKNINMLRGVE